ncbi:hypothetical protein RB594_001102 [Gaeumannomyces avenae]
MSAPEPIAVIGSACRFPGDSDTPSKLWELLRAPRDLLRQVPPERYDADAWHHTNGKHHGATNVRHAYYLNESPAHFDNGFFSIQAGEAEAIDPQQRMLMETVYDSLCAAGQTIEGLRGSQTSVFVGLMCDDWAGLMARDTETFPQYGATGTARSIMSNRISYFFDWHGPSMTIDTACSSSLVAVHQAIQTLHSGESEVAVATGANLLLSPAMFMAESNLSMLSPHGRSRMWDKDVNGYARGEGLASVVLKTLSAAIRDGDHIECVIRATGVNQDGRTGGITMPSAKAQAALVRSTYARAGLDINKPEDRPQFFHAHGTGTPAGDPQEAEAISRAFYSQGQHDDKLYVGSIKTIVGHTEGTAGLAGLIGTSLALQHGIIPPNMHFKTLNPKLKPFYTHLQVPTKCIPWPEPRPGQPRRASINSFGFGGTNAHAILEAYQPPAKAQAKSAPPMGALFTPLVFSAASESSLRAMLSLYVDFLSTCQQKELHDLAYTLQHRRSTLSYRVAISAPTPAEARHQLEAILGGEKMSAIGTRQLAKGSSSKILGVFTGQGAQWARMGARLLETSPFVFQRLAQLDQALAESPAGDAPDWRLRDMILADPKTSRVGEAAISQPLCTALQIVLVDMLGFAGVRLHSVVGHSSGEIGAAYAAGLLSAADAIRVAYYRGLYAKLAESPNRGAKGAMMAVGTTFEDATEFCELEWFKGRIQVAALNSSSSITLSGDEDAIDEAVTIFQDEGKFARKLKVDTAYHSSHVMPCAAPYLAAMDKCGIEGGAATGVKWHSSVHAKTVMSQDKMSPQYWVDNMVNPVLFSPAAGDAWTESGPFDLAIEVGPAPVLKTPALDSIESVSGGQRPPYTGVLARGKDDVHEFSNALGYVWTQLGAGSVAFASLQRAVSGSEAAGRFLPNLPKYPFDHSREFMALSRVSGLHKTAQDPIHPLLGRRCHDRETSQSMQWRNILSPKEVPWLAGHRVQGQMVFPATGYISMTLEAISLLAGASDVGLFELRDLQIVRALTFNDEDDKVETLFDLKDIRRSSGEITADFALYSGSPYDIKSALALNTAGTVRMVLAAPQADQLPRVELDEVSLSSVDTDRFYAFLSKLGYNYAWPFHGTTSIRRKADYSVGTIEDQSASAWEDQLIVHPGMLDTALQTAFAAFSCPGDERMWDLHLPKSFRSILINPYFTPLGVGKQANFGYVSAARVGSKLVRAAADITLFSEEGGYTFMQVDEMEIVPFSAAVQANDAVVFSRFQYKVAEPDAALVVVDDGCEGKTAAGEEIAAAAERLAFYYLRRLLEKVTAEERAGALPHFKSLLDYADECVPRVVRGENGLVPAAAAQDTASDMDALVARHGQDASIRLLRSVGENLAQVVLESGDMLQHASMDAMLQSSGLAKGNEWIASLAEQMSHRFPKMNLLEIGAGSGSSAREIVTRLGDAFLTYTYADVSGSVVPKAQELFKGFENRMVFKPYDLDESPAGQGLAEGAYDVVVCSSVLRAARDVEATLKHVRSLVKPGGYVFVQEVVATDDDSLRACLAMGSLPEWWPVSGVADDAGRNKSMTLTLDRWGALLQKTGFRGVESATPEMPWVGPGRVFVAQAVDERTEMLRDPVVHLAALPATRAPQLYLVGGGKTAEVKQMCDALYATLSPRFPKTVRHESVEAFNQDVPLEGSTVLCLTELEQPLMEVITPEKLDALRLVYKRARDVMFVTRGARRETPHSYMLLGMGRCMRFEYPGLNLLAFDLDRVGDDAAATVARQLLRLELAGRWALELQPGELLMSVEPEVSMEDGRMVIPRIYKDDERNRRYNTTRRVVKEDVDPATSRLVFESREGPWEAQVPSPLDMPAPLPFDVPATRTLRVTHFVPATITVSQGARLMPLVGRAEPGGELYLAAAHLTESPATVPVDWTFALQDGTDPVAALASFAAALAARRIASLAGSGDTIVVHEPPAVIADALQACVKDLGISVLLTTSDRHSSSDRQQQQQQQYLDEKLSEHALKALLPRAATKFLDLSQSRSSAAQKMAKCLPRGCDVIIPSSVFHQNTELRSSASPADIAGAVKAAWSASQKQLGGSSRHEVQAIMLQDLAAGQADSSSSSSGSGRLAVVDCTSPLVPAAVRAIDDGTLFRGDRTYWLVGLANEMGLSICRWMVERGARHVALTSRSPKVHPAFIDRMARLGAAVKTFAMDVTDRASLHAAYASLTEAMPPVAGVANGAMLMRDSLFENMSYENFTACTNPKVIGSLLLDELFGDAPLDFFVAFSSIAAVTGNSGQCNYVSSNLFMNGLAEKRRARGVVGSAADISPVIGLGFVERTDSLTEDTFTEMGYRPVSEQDVQVIFAESILAGRVDGPGESEVISGVQPLFDDFVGRDQYMKDVKFNHFWMERTDSRDLAGGRSLAVSVRAQLALAASKAEVLDIVREEFLVRLRKILSLGADEAVNERVTFVEQGLDSLMAVEVRAWLVKELDVDVPVLKILGGSSIADLLEHAIKSLPESIVDVSKLGDGTPGQAKKKAPAPVPKAAPPASASLPASPPRDVSPQQTSSNSVTGSGTPVDDKSVSGSATPLSTPDESLMASAFFDGSVENRKKLAEVSDDSTDMLTSPMSFGQTGFWFLNEYLAGKAVFNIAMMYKFTGPIRMSALEDAVRLVGGRHETFRTRFFWAGEGDARVPMQGIGATSPVELRSRRISSEAEAVEEMNRVRAQPWDLESDNLITLTVLSLSNKVHYMVAGMHHILFDGYSFTVLFKELELAYTAKNLPPLPAESQYRAFASRQRGDYEAGKMAHSVEYYRSVLPAAEDLQPIALLPFAKTTARQALTRYGQHEATFQIEAELAAKVRQLARQSRSTSFHVYLVALEVLLFRLLPDADDVFIGIADANRSDKTFMDSMGFFLNLLPLRFCRPQADAKLGSVIEQGRDAAYAALEHSRLPFDALLRELNVPRSSEHTPLFQVFLDYKQIYQERSAWCGCKVENERWELASTGYDVSLEVSEDTSGGVMLRLDLQDTLYTEESTRLMLRSYVGVIEYMTSAADGGILGDVPKWSPQDVQATLVTGKGTPLDAQWQPTIIHRIEELAQTQPDKTALKDDDGRTLTYQQMTARIDAIQHALETAGLQKGGVVGVFQEPSADWTCSMLAVLRAGGVYVPLDLRNSIPRLASIVKASKPAFLLTDRTTESQVSLIGADAAAQVSVSNLKADDAAAAAAAPSTTNRAERGAPAVVLFTSGSTGEPKGIVMTHTNLVANAEANSHVYAATAQDGADLVVLQQSAYSFDFSIDQTLAALTNGGRLHVVAARHRGDPAAISKIMLDEGVTYTSSTPSEFEMWLRYGRETLRRCASWRWAFSGGEPMHPGLPREFSKLKLGGSLRLFTGYGPAETTCFSTKIELPYTSPDAIPDPLPAGRMLRGYTVCVVDEALRPVPHGVPGEIVIGGACVVSGYLDNAASTGAKFLADEFFGSETKVYRSGDRGRLLGDGTLFCDGRLEGDLQVKIRGFRVELVEVEEAILRCSAGTLSQAVVSVRGGEGEDRYLAAHVVFRPGVTSDEQAMTLRALRHRLPLPPYMRPSAIATLDEIPRTAHLKVDRKAITALPVVVTGNQDDESAGEDSLTDTERRLAALWREVMPVGPGALGSHSDFFLVGGNSILLVKLQSRIRASFGAAPKLVALMGAHTLAAMAAAVESSSGSAKALIDWQAETEVPEALLATKPRPRAPKTDNITVLMTGSQGYLGRHILAALVKDPKVSSVQCLVRKENTTAPLDAKVTEIEADVSQPSLSLSPSTFSALSSSIDVVVHCAANRSFWDRYETLRADNLSSVKELARLAAPRSVPLHILSSGAVATYDGPAGVTTPPTDGSDGYVATKWAAETFLRRLAAATNLPVHSHRPTGDGAPVVDEAGAAAPLLEELMGLVAKVGARPDFSGVRGHVGLVPVKRTVEDITKAVLASSAAAASVGGGVQVQSHKAAVRVAVDVFEKRVAGDEEGAMKLLPAVGVLDWFGMAKRAGWGQLMTSWELVMGSSSTGGTGELELRR